LPCRCRHTARAGGRRPVACRQSQPVEVWSGLPSPRRGHEAAWSRRVVEGVSGSPKLASRSVTSVEALHRPWHALCLKTPAEAPCDPHLPGRRVPHAGMAPPRQDPSGHVVVVGEPSSVGEYRLPDHRYNPRHVLDGKKLLITGVLTDEASRSAWRGRAGGGCRVLLTGAGAE
jgi:hypothetical protein